MDNTPSNSIDLTRRACDQCRLRKIRCDRNIPCAHCTTINQQCSFTGAGQRPKDHRQRILISTQYERKIDHIEHGLVKIEKALFALSEAQRRIESSIHTRPSAVPSTILIPSSASSTLKHPGEQNENHGPDPNKSGGSLSHKAVRDPAFEGDSSMTAHAAFASSFVDRAVQQSSYGNAGPSFKAALSSLHQLLHVQKPKDEEDHFPREKPWPMNGLTDLPMPPVDTVLPILRELKRRIPVTFTLVCAFDNIDYFTGQCRDIYFATDTFSQSTFIIANAGLYFMFQEKMVLARYTGDEEATASLQANIDMCRDNLETVLAHLNLLLPAQKENVVALLMGASYSIEISRPSLAWRLNTTACQLCLTLGYHRAGNLRGETEELKNSRAVLFWFVYILDRALSLRLGRPPVLQDYEITLPRKLEPLGEFDSHRELIQSWMVRAEVQGKIYADLHSPEALTRPIERRSETVRVCAQALLAEREKLKHLRTRLEQSADNAADGSNEIASMLLRSDELAMLSTLTLIYRSLPPDYPSSPASSMTFSSDCIEMSREAMRVHLECIGLVEKTPMLATAYMHWIILYSPFIPFIVLFCYVVEGSGEDVQLIERFMTTLEPWRGLSAQTDKLYQLCRVLNDLARAYADARKAIEAQRQSDEWNHDGMNNMFVEPQPTPHQPQLNLIPDQQSSVDLGSDHNSSAQVPLEVGFHTSQMGDLFTEYMSLMDMADFVTPDWLRQEPSFMMN